MVAIPSSNTCVIAIFSTHNRSVHLLFHRQLGERSFERKLSIYFFLCAGPLERSQSTIQAMSITTTAYFGSYHGDFHKKTQTCHCY
jgi:hypothetical protein